MLYIQNDSNDPAFNLALEEFLVKTEREPYASQDIALLWQNRPTVVIGRNQNASHELNREQVEKEGISVVRRLSGGGAVYHDKGTINFTIVIHDGAKHKGDFRFFTEPLAEALASIGVEVQFSGRNDVEVEGAKFSGNAQYSYKNTLLHHGTILYDTNLAALASVLKPKKQAKVSVSGDQKSRGVSSVRRMVTNLSEHTEVSVNEFIDIFSRVLSGVGQEDALHKHKLSPEELEFVEDLASKKYRTDSWTWGKSPLYTEVFEQRFTGANLMLALAETDGIITEFDLYGDFFEKKPIEKYTEKFLGTRRDNLEQTIGSLSAEDYILSCGNEELLHLLLPENRIK